MPLFITILAITIAQLPGLVMRYLPFSRVLELERKKKLFLYYAAAFIFQHLAVYILVKGDYNNVTLLTYKRLLFLLSTIYVFINIAFIKGNLYKHIFIYGMQGGYSLFLHSIVALFVGRISTATPLYIQLSIQTIGYSILFTLFFIPLWKKVSNSIIFNSQITNDYYWNVIWMIPALAIYSDAMVTMNNQWINSLPQIISRIMTALSLIISWKWITLDFESLENMLYLKNQNKIMNLQTEGILAQAEILRESENHIKICKHDMRHNLGIIRSLIQDKKTEDVLNYIEELDTTMNANKPLVYCKNTIVNSALLVYMSKAKEKNIDVKLELNIPDKLPWNSNDIAILIANAFENAIIASSKQSLDEQEIYISARFYDEKLAIIFKNRFNGEILIGSSGFPTSTEPGHGIGMQSILSIVNKYKASASCTSNNGWFNMTFLFT